MINNEKLTKYQQKFIDNFCKLTCIISRGTTIKYQGICGFASSSGRTATDELTANTGQSTGYLQLPVNALGEDSKPLIVKNADKVVFSDGSLNANPTIKGMPAWECKQMVSQGEFSLLTQYTIIRSNA